MPDDEEVQEDNEDERMQNLSRPRNKKKEFDDEDEYEGEDLEIEEEFVRIKSFKCR